MSSLVAFSTFTVLLLSVPSLVPFHPHTKALCAHRAGTKEGGPSCRLLAVLVTTNLPLSLDFPILDMSRVVAVRSLSHVRLCSPVDCSASGFPVRHPLPQLAQTHVH